MRNVVTTAFALALAACGAQPDNQGATAANESVATETNVAVPPQSEESPAPAPDESPSPPTAEPSPAPAPEPAPGPAPDEPEEDAPDSATVTIPAALRGRWGLTPGDCTSTRGDAKGLLRVTRDTLRFYESRGTLGRVVERDRSRIVADFSFMGEGQTWERRMVLDGQKGGKTLIRREYGEGAMPGVLRYQRCEA